MNRLFVYGDSWPYGADLENHNEESFPSVLGKLKKCLVINRSIPATSIDHAVFYFLEDYKIRSHNNEDNILFCLTGQTRSMCFVDHKPFELHPRGEDQYAHVYYKYLHSDEFDTFNFTRNVLLLNFLCKERGLKSHFVSNWDQVSQYLQEQVNFYSRTLVEILHPERNQTINFGEYGDVFYKSEFINHTGHPTALGHRKIAEELAKWIS